mgnify:CR=1 FL=1
MSKKQIKTWFDGQLVWIEHEADRLGYPIDDDIGYQQVCEQLTNIEFNYIKPDGLDWANIGYVLGCVRGKLAALSEGV